MPITSASTPIELSDYISPMNLELLNTVLTKKEAKFDAGYAKMKSALDSISRLPVSKNPELLQDAVNQITQKINDFGEIDLQSPAVLSEIENLSSYVTANKAIAADISGTQQAQQVFKNYQEGLRTGKATASEGFDITSQVEAWYKDGNPESNLNLRKYQDFYDTNKVIIDRIKGLHKDKTVTYKTDGNNRITQVYIEKELYAPEKLSAVIQGVMEDPRAAYQAFKDFNYLYKDMKDEDLVKEADVFYKKAMLPRYETRRLDLITERERIKKTTILSEDEKKQMLSSIETSLTNLEEAQTIAKSAYSPEGIIKNIKDNGRSAFGQRYLIDRKSTIAFDANQVSSETLRTYNDKTVEARIDFDNSIKLIEKKAEEERKLQVLKNEAAKEKAAKEGKPEKVEATIIDELNQAAAGQAIAIQNLNPSEIAFNMSPMDQLEINISELSLKMSESKQSIRDIFEKSDFAKEFYKNAKSDKEKTALFDRWFKEEAMDIMEDDNNVILMAGGDDQLSIQVADYVNDYYILDRNLKRLEESKLALNELLKQDPNYVKGMAKYDKLAKSIDLSQGPTSGDEGTPYGGLALIKSGPKIGYYLDGATYSIDSIPKDKAIEELKSITLQAVRITDQVEAIKKNPNNAHMLKNMNMYKFDGKYTPNVAKDLNEKFAEEVAKGKSPEAVWQEWFVPPSNSASLLWSKPNKFQIAGNIDNDPTYYTLFNQAKKISGARENISKKFMTMLGENYGYDKIVGSFNAKASGKDSKVPDYINSIINLGKSQAGMDNSGVVLKEISGGDSYSPIDPQKVNKLVFDEKSISGLQFATYKLPFKRYEIIFSVDVGDDKTEVGKGNKRTYSLTFDMNNVSSMKTLGFLGDDKVKFLKQEIDFYHEDKFLSIEKNKGQEIRRGVHIPIKLAADLNTGAQRWALYSGKVKLRKVEGGYAFRALVPTYKDGKFVNSEWVDPSTPLAHLRPLPQSVVDFMKTIRVPQGDVNSDNYVFGSLGDAYEASQKFIAGLAKDYVEGDQSAAYAKFIQEMAERDRQELENLKKPK